MKTAAGILVLSLCWTVIFILAGIFTGFLTVTASAPWLADPAGFAYRHLRLSIVPFGILFIFYTTLVFRLKGLLNDSGTPVSTLSYYNRLINATIMTFFGVGVIWTAIGMETALMHALDGVNGNSQSLTAWEVLERLVNGGLLLALSTTVFGGACGYILKLLKIVLLGSAWDRAILERES